MALEVRRLIVKDKRAFGAAEADKIAGELRRRLREYRVIFGGGYNNKTLLADSYLLKDGSLDGEAIIRDYQRERHLMFMPDGIKVSVDIPELKDKHQTSGFGRDNVAFVSRYGFQAYSPPDIAMHEVGHAWFGLQHHQEEDEFIAPICAMSVGVSPIYCDDCSTKIDKAQTLWLQRYALVFR